MTDDHAAPEVAAGEDPTLRVPELPDLSRVLGSPAFPLRRDGRLDDDPPFTLAGARVLARGGHARGLDQLRCSTMDLLADLRIEGAVATGSVLTPVGLERRLEVGGAPVLERIAAPRSDPVCFFEWLPESDASLTLTWRVPGPPVDAGSGEALRWRVLDRGLLVAAGADRGLFALSATSAALEVVPSADGEAGGLRVRVRLEAADGEALRLAAAGIAGGDDEGRILRVMSRPHVVIATRRAEAQRIVEDRLRVESPDAGLDEALSWAKLRLASLETGAAHEEAALPSRAVRPILAALASGDTRPARAVLRGLDAAPADPDPGFAGRHLLIVARYLAWTGDLRAVKRAWAGVRARAEICLDALAAGTEDEIVAHAVRDLVVAAEESGDAALARRLKAAASDRAPTPDAAPHSSLASGPDDGSDPLLRGAALIEAVVQGLLGAEPDAPRGRLILRPRLPGSWERFAARSLAVGEARVDLEYDRAGPRHGFTVRQERGSAPLRVVLEPELEGRRLVVARVDGESATLDPVRLEGRLRVPVQLVLDHERRLEVEIEPPDA